MKETLPQIALNFMAETGQQPIANIPEGVEAVLTDEKVAMADETAPLPAEEAIPLAGTVTAGAGVRSNTGKSKRGRKSLKQATAEADLIDIPDDESLFRKQYYTMGEVAGMFRVNQSLLRFWETEFNILQPRKNKKGDRHFRPVDIKNLHLIYHLLRQRKYTIEGAKEFLKKNKKAEERFEAIQRLQQVKAFLLEWKAQL
jgi:DNA-binding transcriptional MerR regulator